MFVLHDEVLLSLSQRVLRLLTQTRMILLFVLFSKKEEVLNSPVFFIEAMVVSFLYSPFDEMLWLLKTQQLSLQNNELT